MSRTKFLAVHDTTQPETRQRDPGVCVFDEKCKLKPNPYLVIVPVHTGGLLPELLGNVNIYWKKRQDQLIFWLYSVSSLSDMTSSLCSFSKILEWMSLRIKRQGFLTPETSILCSLSCASVGVCFPANLVQIWWQREGFVSMHDMLKMNGEWRRWVL